MCDPETLIRPVLFGNPRYPRYAIAVDRSPSTPTLYWTGQGDDPCTDDRSRAMRWADYGGVTAMLRGMGMAT